MASTVSKKRLRRSIEIAGHRTAGRDKHPRRDAPKAARKQNWLEQAREARAHTPLSGDSTELLRQLRAAGAQ